MSYELINRWVPEELYYLKAPFPMMPEGIVVHNTAGSASAIAEAENMVNNGSPVGFHVIVDEQYVVECIPFDRNAWHAGDGNGYGNSCLIGLEIARSMDYETDRYDRAEANAVTYIAYVCVEHGWTSENLYQHNWFSATECPHRLKEHWEAFKRAVDAEILNIKEGEEESMLTPEQENYVANLHEKHQESKPSKWAENELEEAIEEGITDGTRPQDIATREEAACMVLRMQKNILKRLQN